MKVWGDFLEPLHRTDKTTLIIMIRKLAMIRDEYNQVLHLRNSLLTGNHIIVNFQTVWI